MDYVSLGRRINKRRRELHMTQEQLGEKLKLSTSFVGHIERGTRKASLETLITLCNILDVSPNYLLERSLKISSPDSPHVPPDLSREERKKLRQIVETFNNWLDDPDAPEEDEPLPKKDAPCPEETEKVEDEDEDEDEDEQSSQDADDDACDNGNIDYFK